MNRRNRLPLNESCYKHPGGRRAKQIPSEKIPSHELALRVAIERRHEAGVAIATLDHSAAVAEYAAAADGRCHGCGELIGDVMVCPICQTFQKTAGQTYSKMRKTIGGFCRQDGEE